MKNVKSSRNFNKRLKQRVQNNSKLLKKFEERLEMFVSDRSNPILRDHALIGNKFGYRSFSITGDYRVLYIETEEDIILDDIGTHSQVY